MFQMSVAGGHNRPAELADTSAAKLFDLLHSHQLAYKQGRYYYCWWSARIYNQYKTLGLIDDYYRTLARVRESLGRVPRKAGASRYIQ